MNRRPPLPGQRARARGERGSVSLELAVVFPVVLLLIFGTVQAALYFHARNVALAAAEEGLRDARVENGSDSAGVRRAEAFLVDAGGSRVLLGFSVTADRGATEATVTVQGTSPSVLPGIGGFAVAQSATGPRERVTTP